MKVLTYSVAAVKEKVGLRGVGGIEEEPKLINNDMKVFNHIGIVCVHINNVSFLLHPAFSYISKHYSL